MFEVDIVKNEAILRDFLNFRTWEREKRRNSARLNSKMDSWVQSWRPRTNAFWVFFHSICLKYCACNEKSHARSCKVLHLRCKITLENLEIWCSRMHRALRKSAPWPPNISDEHLLSCACHATCIFPDPLQMSHACQCFWNCYKTLTPCSLLARCRIPCACHATSEPKAVRACGVLHILTLKRASRQNGVHLFDISKLPKVVWTEREVFSIFWLPKVLRATAACNFSSFI